MKYALIAIGIVALAGLAFYLVKKNQGVMVGGKTLDQNVYTSSGPAPGKDAAGNLGGGVSGGGTLGSYLAGIFGKAG